MTLCLFYLTTVPVHRLPLAPADIEVACYGYEGIDAVKDALRAGLGCSTEAMPIKVIQPYVHALNAETFPCFQS